jgi:AraC-like DNA-binding protein
MHAGLQEKLLQQLVGCDCSCEWSLRLCRYRLYVIQQRLAKAQELLRTTDRSIVEIAIESGFTNQSHLTTVFRKNLSTTPKKYRDRP